MSKRHLQGLLDNGQIKDISRTFVSLFYYIMQTKMPNLNIFPPEGGIRLCCIREVEDLLRSVHTRRLATQIRYSRLIQRTQIGLNWRNLPPKIVLVTSLRLVPATKNKTKNQIRLPQQRVPLCKRYRGLVPCDQFRGHVATLYVPF